MDKTANWTLPVFVISLKGADQRRAYMRDLLGKHEIPFDFFDAIDGRGFDVKAHKNYNGRKRRLLFGKDLTGGELGCLLSHKAIYQKMGDQNIPQALILEDDVILDTDFKDTVQHLIQSDLPYDLVRFLGSPKVAKRGVRPVAPLPKGYILGRMPTNPGGAHAYLITQNGAKILNHHLEKTAYPIDTLMGRCWETGIECLAITALARHDLEAESFIGNLRFDKETPLQNNVERSLYPVTRALYKIENAIGKSWVYYKNFANDRKNWAKFQANSR